MRLLRSILIAFPLSIVLALAPGCLSSGSDKNVDKRVLVDWEAASIESLATDLVAGLIDSPKLSYLGDAERGDDIRFVTYIDELENDAGAHVATDALAQALQTALIESGKFRIVTVPTGDDAPRIELPEEGEALDAKSIETLGSELGAEIVLVGAFTRADSKGREHDRAHSMIALEAYELQGGTSIWSLSRELRRASYVELFGN